jgi:hypothetical protein
MVVSFADWLTSNIFYVRKKRFSLAVFASFAFKNLIFAFQNLKTICKVQNV